MRFPRIMPIPNRSKARLDALEARLTGPKRIALFGHRNVGKTTLLAMFYRQAAERTGARECGSPPPMPRAPSIWPRRSPRSSPASRWPAPWPRPS